MKKNGNVDVVICPPCGENVALATKRGANKVSPILPLLPRLTAVLPPQGREITTRGFTLIELLVVVLIIGILAAVAVPQYQVAVKKAWLAGWIPQVKALYNAEQTYYLANGEYALDLTQLDVEIGSGCTYRAPGTDIYSYYRCGTEEMIGVWDGPTSAQAGNEKIRYIYFFADDMGYRAKKGDILCVSKGDLERRVCRTLGPGTESEYTGAGPWEYQYKLGN